MTRYEIIAGLMFTIQMFLFDVNTGEILTEPRNDMDKTTINACKGAIELLEQEAKTGHWIDEETNYFCSECYRGCWVNSDYCPWCGADMRGDKNDSRKRKSNQ